jgi:membrane protease YdiL (CAAX protease family)
MENTNDTPVSAPRVLGAWFVAYLGAGVVSVVVVGLTGNLETPAHQVPTWAMAVSIGAMWVTMLALLRRFVPSMPSLTPSVFPTWFRSSDVVIGVPLGIATQLILVNLVNWPLQRIWPDTFNSDEVTKRATDLVDGAQGAWLVLLAIVVVIGAPVVEEVVYRGTVQPVVTSAWGAPIGLAVVAVVFAAIHQSGVEFPGLLAVAVVFGLARHLTGRLGLSIVTHMSFNATALVLVILN